MQALTWSSDLHHAVKQFKRQDNGKNSIKPLLSSLELSVGEKLSLTRILVEKKMEAIRSEWV
jgi:hypothetical protein